MRRDREGCPIWNAYPPSTRTDMDAENLLPAWDDLVEGWARGEECLPLWIYFHPAAFSYVPAGDYNALIRALSRGPDSAGRVTMFGNLVPEKLAGPPLPLVIRRAWKIGPVESWDGATDAPDMESVAAVTPMGTAGRCVRGPIERGVFVPRAVCATLLTAYMYRWGGASEFACGALLARNLPDYGALGELAAVSYPGFREFLMGMAEQSLSKLVYGHNSTRSHRGLEPSVRFGPGILPGRILDRVLKERELRAKGVPVVHWSRSLPAPR